MYCKCKIDARNEFSEGKLAIKHNSLYDNQFPGYELDIFYKMAGGGHLGFAYTAI